MYPLIESIRLLDGTFYHLEEHQHRIDRAVSDLFDGRPLSWNLKSFLSELQYPVSGLFKCRVLYDNLQVTCSFSPYKIRPVKTLKLVKDQSVKYPHKFDDRRAIDALFARRGDADDILVTQNGLVMDCSHANIVLKRSGNWFTPASYLLNGTTRRRLINSGAVQEIPIQSADINKFETFKVINAMLGWDGPESDVSNIG